MPKGYWIPHLDVSNPEGFQAYRDMADAGHKRFGSKLLARGGRREVVEGKMRARNVLREFNSYDEALAFYHGPGIFARPSAARAAFGLRFPDRRGLRRPAAAAGRDAARAGRPQGLLDRACRCDRSRGLQALSWPPIRRRSASSARVIWCAAAAARSMEGRLRSRTVVLEFPSYEAALGCYRSPEYQAAKTLRDGKAEADLVVIEGYDDKQT